MTLPLVVFVVLALVLRVATLLVSIRHERALKADGGVEIGAANSALLAGAHIAFYAAAVTEGAGRGAALDAVAIAGLAIYLVGAVALLAVMRLLGRLWTVKIMIARDHELVIHPLFRRIRHPNYFVAILPELAGFALALHAWVTLVVGQVIYAVPLAARIRQEEAAMRARFPAY